jgi:hypothetical protein
MSDPRLPEEDLPGVNYFAQKVLPEHEENSATVVSSPVAMIQAGLVAVGKMSDRAQHEFQRIHDVIGTLGVKVLSDQEYEFYLSMLRLKREGLLK